VDLVVTSPPYFALRSYQDGGARYDGQVGSEETPAAFVDALVKATREMVRVLKPTGSIFVNLGDKYAGSGGHNNSNIGAKKERGPSRGIPPKSLMGLPWRYALACVDRLGLILRRDLIWHKANALPESVTDRCRSAHEYWFHFVKQGRYFSAIDEIREAHNPANIRHAERYGGRYARADDAQPSGNGHATILPAHPLGKLPGSVWTIASDPLTIPDWAKKRYDLPDHFAAFPQEWPRRLILGWCPPGGVVLDPFGGTGTVAMVARALGRMGLNGDLSGDYCRLARWRIYESGHAAKSEDRTWRDAQGAML
jgi:site-specific DNA-methyltransferase (cytosine-N4-specific)